MRSRSSPFDLAITVAVGHFAVSCLLVLAHLCTTWDPEPVEETIWTTGAPLWSAILFPLGMLPQTWLSPPPIPALPLNSCVVGFLSAVGFHFAHRIDSGGRIGGSLSSPTSKDTPAESPFRLPEGARRPRTGSWRCGWIALPWILAPFAIGALHLVAVFGTMLAQVGMYGIDGGGPPRWVTLVLYFPASLFPVEVLTAFHPVYAILGNSLAFGTFVTLCLFAWRALRSSSRKQRSSVVDQKGLKRA